MMAMDEEALSRRVVELERLVRRHDNLLGIVLLAAAAVILAWIF